MWWYRHDSYSIMCYFIIVLWFVTVLHVNTRTKVLFTSSISTDCYPVLLFMSLRIFVCTSNDTNISTTCTVKHTRLQLKIRRLFTMRLTCLRIFVSLSFIIVLCRKLSVRFLIYISRKVLFVRILFIIYVTLHNMHNLLIALC